MNVVEIFRTVLISYIEDGMPSNLAYLEALILLRHYLAASPSPDAAKNAAKVHSFVQGLLTDGLDQSVALVLYDDSSGSITQIPRPECVRQHLPKERKPTREEIMNAWNQCSSQ